VEALFSLLEFPSVVSSSNYNPRALIDSLLSALKSMMGIASRAGCDISRSKLEL